MLTAASSYTNMSFFEFAVGVALAALIAMGVFHHAHTRGNTHATAWGIGTFLAAIVVVPVYFIRYWLRVRDRPR